MYFQLANDGTQSSGVFMNTVSMMADLDLVVLCKVQAAGLPAGSKTLSYPCTGADMGKVKEMLSRGKTVTLKLAADSDKAVEAANRDNNELSQVLSDVPAREITSEQDLGDMGGIVIDYVKENP